MKMKKYDGADALVVVSLIVFIALWGFLWGYPYPHPDLWSPLAVAARVKGGDATSCCLWLFPVRFLLSVVGIQKGLLALSVVGKLSLGVTASCLYLTLRELWLQYRPVGDDEKESPPEFPFFFTKLLPLVAASVFTLSPYAWRAYQFFSPEAMVLTMSVLAVTCWTFGRNLQHICLYSVAFLIVGAVFATSPVGLVLGFAAIMVDAYNRWHAKVLTGRPSPVKADAPDQFESDVVAEGKKLESMIRVERFVRAVSFVTGFAGALYLCIRAAVHSGAADAMTFGAIASWWTTSEYMTLKGLLGSHGFRFAVFYALAVAVAVKVAWRMHVDERKSVGFWEKRFIAGVLSVLVVVFLCRDVDHVERTRLEAFRDYANLVARGVNGASWFFTDGRLDDSLRLALANLRSPTVVISVISLPNRAEMNRLKSVAPEQGDRDMFAAGGMEIFKSWARERPDRLHESAWQLGGGLINLHGRVKFRTCGGVMRDLETLADSKLDVVGIDREMRALSQRLIALMMTRYASGELFGSVDKTTKTKFDALLWRAARLATERQALYAKADEINESQKERVLATQLDELNYSLKTQGEMIERMLPTEKLVLTPKEALEVALKRADFQLARKYANQVLIAFPEEQSAHFALAMAAMQVKDYSTAARHFEVVRLLKPTEVATLNNLSVCYMQLKRYEEALLCAQRAAELLPEMEKVQKNYTDIRKKVDEIRGRESAK